MFVHSPVDEHLFPAIMFLAITNNAGMNIPVHIFVWTYA